MSDEVEKGGRSIEVGIERTEEESTLKLEDVGVGGRSFWFLLSWVTRVSWGSTSGM